MNILKTTRTYATPATAEAALRKLLGASFDTTRWLVAVTAEGRFAPVVVFDRTRPELVGLAHVGITVVG
jgi:hypothetical protein